jgi:uncharacterized protein
LRLYSGTSVQFVEDTFQGQIAEKLRNAFFEHFRYNPSPSEVSSWRNSLRAMSQVIELSKLMDHGIVLEYQLPLSSRRLDCMICGRDHEREDHAVIVELKQWERCADSESEREVSTRLGGRERDVLHPSVQAGQYKRYLQDVQTVFYDSEVGGHVQLDACCYLHNYNSYSGDVLFSPKFKAVTEDCPVFTADDVNGLSDYLVPRLDRGEGIEVLRRVEASKYRPSKKLMDHVGNVIKGDPEFILLDEQLVVYDKIFSFARRGFHDKQKVVVIVEGGPGTGKSVIAINLMADLSLQGYNAHYATGSKAFTETLWKRVGSRAAAQFKYFNSYADVQDNGIDVLIADESHRIRMTSYNRFTPRIKRKDVPQIEELISAAKVSVFFIDNKQVVRPAEIGSIEYIKDYAANRNCKVFEYKLDVQFRCAGSESFVSWVENTLGISRTADVIWEPSKEDFEFKIMGSPEELEAAIRQKVKEGNTGRLVAGFCWKWSDPKPDGTLEDDVVVGSLRRPWNAKQDVRRLARDIPTASLWATDPNGLEQVGCVYTAQGFEFDYAGVIFGPDLRYNFDSQSWEGHPADSYDRSVKRAGTDFTRLVKNTYRVLFSPAMKGCYVYFMDKDTERFFESRIENDLWLA